MEKVPREEKIRFTQKRINGIMNSVKGNANEIFQIHDNNDRIEEIEERLKDTEDKVNELEYRIERLEETPDEYDKWHDSQI